MGKTIVVYGSTTGTCEGVAETIAQKLGTEAVSAAELTKEAAEGADNLILGTSTWGAGEVQDDWYDALAVLRSADIGGKTAAVFGCGDCESYPDTFCGGMAEIYAVLCEKGAKVVGAVPADGYSFDDSEAARDGQFVGLALDDVNESEKTAQRIDAWLKDIEPLLA